MSDNELKIPWPDWQLVEQIGRGQFGTVYKISCTKYGITDYAALKVISIPSDPQAIENDYSYGYDKISVAQKYKSYLDDVLKEYRLMMRVKSSPNIVRCEDISVLPHDDGIGWDVFIRMEYLTPILRMLSEISDENTIVKLGMDICSALDVCERADILHRDIKPSNILVSEQGDFKLGDFGVSRTLENENTYGTKGIGTYDYMAPEIYNGGKYGKEADLYSLGIVLYWLLNNRTLPFLRKGIAPTAQEVTTARNKRFSGEKLPRPANGSDALVSVVLKACEFEPKLRYKTAKEMLDDLIIIKYSSNVNSAHSNTILTNSVDRVVSATPSASVTGSKEKTTHSNYSFTQDENQNAWSDTQETVGKDYSAKRKTLDDSVTVGKTYSVSTEKTSTVNENTYVKQKKENSPTKETKKPNTSVFEDYNVGDSEESGVFESQSYSSTVSKKATENIRGDYSNRDDSNAHRIDAQHNNRDNISVSYKILYLVLKILVAAIVLIPIIALLAVLIKGKTSNNNEEVVDGEGIAASINEIHVGSTVYFGSYEQDNNTSNGKEDIEWIVLAKEDDKILVISKYALDCQPYNTISTGVTWETCSLRTWLNETFLSEAFTDEEIEMIPSINISAGNSTTDRVFLLSIYEVNTYLSSDSARQCQATAFCYNASTDSDSKENCWWWLRSTGYSPIFAAGVDSLGGIDYDGFHVITCDRCVRPAMWIELES